MSPQNDCESIQNIGQVILFKKIFKPLLFGKSITNKENVPAGKQLFHFEQPVPVQSYLISIAAGSLKSREIGPRFVDIAAVSITNFISMSVRLFICSLTQS